MSCRGDLIGVVKDADEQAHKLSFSEDYFLPAALISPTPSIYINVWICNYEDQITERALNVCLWL